MVLDPVRNPIPAALSRTQLSVDHALTMLQSLALTFHMRRFFDESSGGERIERDILALSDDRSWATYQHVRTMCEYFTQPIRTFLEGGENPLWIPNPAPMTKGGPTRRPPALSQFPGITETGLTWPDLSRLRGMAGGHAPQLSGDNRAKTRAACMWDSP